MDGTMSTEIPHHPILTSKFNVLIGEESQRSFIPVAAVSNPTALSDKEKAMAKELTASIQEVLDNPETTDDQKKQILAEERKRLLTNFQDQREIRANRIIKYLFQNLRLRKKFNDGFKNALLSAEEIYDVSPIGNKPNMEVLNPLNVYTIMDGNSNRIEDADIIVIENYRSLGQILDRHHEQLTKKDIKQIEDHTHGYSAPGEDNYVGGKEPYFTSSAFETDDPVLKTIDIAEALAGINGHTFGPYYDTAGNIRELRVLWRSKKPVQIVKYPNPATGEEETMIMPETYIPDESKGEYVKTIWVNWWWDAYKIGDDTYFGGPCQIQVVDMSNPSIVLPPIVGTVYNTNGGRGVSLMDRCKTYQYMYNLIWDRLRNAMVNWWPPIMEMDDAKKPDKWSFEKWMFYARKMNVLRVDSFNTKSEGMHKGALGGNYNTTGRMLYADIGNYIQQLVNMLQFIELQVSIVTGVTKQREGQTKDRETASGIQQSLLQSTSITEPLFVEHEETKLRVTRQLVETCKYLWRGKKFQAQYVLDNGSLDLFDVDGDEFADNDYDINIIDGSVIRRLDQAMDMLGQAAMQNDQASLLTLVDLYTSASLAEKRLTLQVAQEEAKDRRNEQHEQQKELQQMNIDAAKEQRLESRLDDRWSTIFKGNVDIERALIQAESFGNVENEKDIEKLTEKRNKLMEDMKDLESQMREKKRQSKIKGSEQVAS